MSVVKRVVSALVGLLLAASVAHAQGTSTGSIAGEVKDATGAVLPGVTVEASSPALIEKTRSVVTDGQGRYQIVELRPGTYVVTFSLPGFNTVKREGVELTSGFTANIGAEMRVGAIEETITVSGATPVVDTQNTRSQNVLSRETLDSLPTFKTYYGMAALTVGVNTKISGGGQDVGGTFGDAHGYITIHGGREGDGHTNWDGMSFNTLYGSGGGSTKQYFINQAGAQEIVLSTAGQTAETQTGGIGVNVVPKDGGNRLSVYSNVSFANDNFQKANIDDELRRNRGVLFSSQVKKIYDYGLGVGGPIRKDKLWFYTAHRAWGNQQYSPGNFYNATPHTMFYTADTTRPGFTDFYQRDHSLRLTWQAAQKHKITGFYSNQKNCACNFYVQYFAQSPEAVVNYTYFPIALSQGTWSFPASNKLLFEAGVSHLHNMTAPRPWEGKLPTDISITDLSRNYQYNSYAATSLNVAQYGEGHFYPQHNERFSMSYVTGTHAFKVGGTTQKGFEEYRIIEVPGSISYQFLGRTPANIVQWASPSYQRMNLDMNLGLYAQDQWTIDKLTMNLGIRYDYLSASVPAQTRPGGIYTGPFNIQEINRLPSWHDVSPRLGAAYDLFGNGRTALKFQVGRYVVAEGTGIARQVNPSNTIASRTVRTWADANSDYRPDCNLFDFGANGECGAIDNRAFGTSVITSRLSKNVTEGFGARPYNWQTSAGVSHELVPGTSVSLTYFRTSFGNFTVVDNQLVTPANYDPFCVTAPVDARLPNGGGYQVCGLYDINPSVFGRVNNLIDLSGEYSGDRSQVYNGVDFTFQSRFRQRGLLQGGFSIGRTVTTNCNVVDVPNGARAFAPGAPAQPADYCQLTPPWKADSSVKLAAVYPLPYDIQVSATYQNLPGVPLLATGVFTSAQVRQSLGRDLATGASGTVQVDLVKPFTMFDERVNQVDFRLNKTFKFAGNKRLQGMLDVYNIMNANTVTGAVGTYGPAWLRAIQVMGGRLVKVGAQFDF